VVVDRARDAPGLSHSWQRVGKRVPAAVKMKSAGSAARPLPGLATTTLGALGLASSSDISAINSQLATINGQINDLYGRTSKAFSGVSMAFAMAGVPTLMPQEKFAATMNWGTFAGTNELALNAAVRLTDRAVFTGGIGYGVDGNIVGARAGLRVGF
jgi:hypothetical protein